MRRSRARFLGAALSALLGGSFAGATGLVLCLGSDGHRAVEPEHPGTECPTLASSRDASGVQPSADCFDLPGADAGPATLSSGDADRVPVAPVTFLPASPEPAPAQTRLAAPIDARAAPPNLAAHLRSTVLLV